jgi:hypothetical protein
MAAFARTVTPSLVDNTVCDAHRLPPLTAGEALIPGPCYIKSDGTVWQSNGTAANAAAKVHGWATKAYPNVGGAVTLYVDVSLAWGPSTATPGATLYLSTTKGELDTATTTGDSVGIAKVVRLETGEGTPHAIIRVRQAW